jgi:DMSO/TMAO reductase YedYZ heme-binding membrane subunit
MTTTEIIVFVGLAALIIATQMGRRRLSARRVLIPLLAVGYVAYQYLHSVPTAGGDLDFEIGLGVAGALCGVLAAGLMTVERDERTGQLVTEAGIAYAALWIAVFGGRLVFAWGATHLWSHQVAQFSVQHAITGSAAWTAAFILMALAMVVTRTVVVGMRALLAPEPLSAPAINGR